jgi:ABC-type bacteriocin/lantibiotic exporter with double-glycine peptidase domain
MNNYFKVYSLLMGEKKSYFFFLLLTMLGMAILQTAGIASIFPFITVLSAPEAIYSNEYLSFYYRFFNFRNQNSFLIFLGICTLAILIVGNAFSAFTTRTFIRFTFFQGCAISQKLFKRYITQPYTFFLNRSSAELVKNIITEIDRCVIGVFTPAIDILTRSILIVFILTFLVTLDPLLAIILFLVCGGSYFFVFKISRQSLSKSGKRSAASQTARSKIVSEAFGGIKELKLLCKESHFIKLYKQPSHEFARCQTHNKSISELPKYALETVIFGGMLLIILYLIRAKNQFEEVIPLLALYAFAGYRLMPAFQRIFAGFTAIRYYLPVLNIIYNDITENRQQDMGKQQTGNNCAPLNFNDSITLHDITYRYPHSDTKVLDNLNLTVPANTTIGFVGATGTGKTTLIDIILGLLPLSEGELRIDTILLDSTNVRNWQKNIGYVPQQIFLTDDTVTKNIAFGIKEDAIDILSVKYAARVANIHDFVMKELPHGYDTNLGERGIRLSGGQRQRIGIARALYYDPKVLILDEATSALDGVTENTIIDALHHLGGKKTIIMIAHRLATLKECNTIHVMENGKIIASGTHDELIQSSAQFRAMGKAINAPAANQ